MSTWKFFVGGGGGGGGSRTKHGKVKHNLVSTFAISHLSDTSGDECIGIDPQKNIKSWSLT